MYHLKTQVNNIKHHKYATSIPLLAMNAHFRCLSYYSKWCCVYQRCELVCLLQVASESGHCIIKREHEKCMERIAMHNPDDAEFGKGGCVRACGFICIFA